MPTLSNSQVAPPKGWDEFEDIVCSAAKNRWGQSDFTRHGRQGQSQNGVDVYGKDGQGQWICLQCKNTWAGLTEQNIVDEILKAETFKPVPVTLYIATTISTDKTLQAFVRKLSEERIEANNFGVEILFWSDIWNDLTLNEERVYQHFPHLRPTTSMPPTPSHDLKLFQEFQSILAFEPAIRLLRDHDFGGPFLRVAIQPLYDFVETWNQPEKEFLDQELQTLLTEIYSAAKEMSYHLVEKTVPIGNNEFASVYSDNLRTAGPRPDWVIKEARVLNEQATLFVPIYENFLRKCRSKLLR